MRAYGTHKIRPVYGNYKPIERRRNNVKIAGWKPSTKQGESVSFDNTYNDTAEVVIEGNSVQDGIPTPGNPVPVNSVSGNLISRGKNLFDKDNYNLILGYFSGINVITSNGGHQIIWLPCKTNTTYTVQRGYFSDNDRFYVAYTTDVPAIRSTVYGRVGSDGSNIATSYTITTGAEAKYICVWVRWSGSGGTLKQVLSTVQLEEGSVATPYEPYHNTTITLPTLRKVGDVADTYNPATGELLRKIDPDLDNCATQSIAEVGGDYVLETPVPIQLTPVVIPTYPRTTVIEQDSEVKGNIIATAKIIDDMGV